MLEKIIVLEETTNNETQGKYELMFDILSGNIVIKFICRKSIIQASMYITMIVDSAPKTTKHLLTQYEAHYLFFIKRYVDAITLHYIISKYCINIVSTVKLQHMQSAICINYNE